MTALTLNTMLTSKRVVQFTASLARNYATRYPRPRPGTSERPPLKHKDPLTTSSSSTVTTLSDNEGLTFIHRPPPSAPSPISFTTAPASPLLRPAPSEAATADTPLPPLLHRKDPVEHAKLSPEEVEKMKTLRASDPRKYSTNALAKMFNCSRLVVSVATRIPTRQRTAIQNERDAKHQAQRERWSERHQIVKAVRARRRELW
ncbi:mitochondrial ribosomal protein subunit L20-domain-containing protein [Coprinopsis sp. MPI-PUGE-AT-0042]|nr:mitochondrial ribosomal protein subunit L20-domain-containing protein [Coprinopsis sp. MPI-PUGE-AT-0042]